MPTVAGSEVEYQRRERRAEPCERDPTPQALARLIEGEIIPRLLLAHQSPVRAPVAIEPSSVERFALDALSLDIHQLLGSIEALLARGVTVESVLLDLLAPAARNLGELWDRDACDFVDVTMGLWRLQQLVHELADRSDTSPRAGRHALFAVAPGEQHSLGSLIVEEFFRRAGWRTRSCGGGERQSLLDEVANTPFALVGITVTCAETVDHLGPLITELRAVSRNPAVTIMVGGRVFAECPRLAVEVGADGTAADGLSAVARAEALVSPIPDTMPLHH